MADIDSLRLADMLGNGVSGLLWSADANGYARDSMFFLDFTGGIKPCLLSSLDNHTGSVTWTEYAPSTGPPSSTARTRHARRRAG